MAPKIFYFIDLASALVTAHTSRPADPGTSAVIVTEESEMVKVPTKVLIALHNQIRPERPITKFADRATANHRMWPALEVLAGKPLAPTTPAADIDAAPTEGDSSVPATKTKRVAKKTSAFVSPKGEKTREARGRTSKLAAHTIEKLVSDNPRREGTFGHKSFSVVKNGMTVEKYIAAGGRLKDLQWDINKKFVKLVKP